MPAEILGNDLTPKKIEYLPKSEIIIKFTPFIKQNKFSKKIEKELRRRYGPEGKEPDYSGNRLRFEGNKLRCMSHDCGDPSCEGLGDIYYVSGKEILEIAKIKE